MSENDYCNIYKHLQSAKTLMAKQEHSLLNDARSLLNRAMSYISKYYLMKEEEANATYGDYER